MHISVIELMQIPLCGATQPLDLLSPLNHLSIRCEIPLYLAGRWGFETVFNLSTRFCSVELRRRCPTDASIFRGKVGLDLTAFIYYFLT